MTITQLSNFSVAELTETFNVAFSDYIVPFKITEDQLAEKLRTANIQLDLSPGAVVDDKLVGFIWHGLGWREGKTVIWNGGTGVVPDQRGKGITGKLYDYILPMLKERGYERSVLEVIIGNDPAIHTYQKKGFEIVRTLDCFRAKATPSTGGTIKDVARPKKELAQRILNRPYDWSAFHQLRSWQPTYQNDDARMDLLGEQVKAVGAFLKNELVGYILFDARIDRGDIYQFGVHPDFRQQGVGRYLFEIAESGKSVPLKVINVDAAHTPSLSFFQHLNFERTIGQYEMTLKI